MSKKDVSLQRVAIAFRKTAFGDGDSLVGLAEIKNEFPQGLSVTTNTVNDNRVLGINVESMKDIMSRLYKRGMPPEQYAVVEDPEGRIVLEENAADIIFEKAEPL